MDRVKLGRALGYGARHAAKALTQAVDAATSPSVSGSTTTHVSSEARPSETKPSPPRSSAPRQQDLRQDLVNAARTVAQSHQTMQQTRSRVRGAAKMAGKSALAPVAKFSSVLWLEVTGTFFALVALAMCDAVWKLRGAWKLPAMSNERLKLYVCAALATLFLYFTISNFVRAARRQRR